MAPPAATSSPLPGPSASGSRNRTAEALHAWCCKQHDTGYVFSQDELLGAGIIPNQDLQILLTSVQHLVAHSLFRVHDRIGGTIGWELVDQDIAKNYAGLTRDERLVLQCVDGAKTSGIWTKTIKNKTALHARVLDRVYKNLEAKSLIKPMKNVNFPSRKMYILAGLEPSEDVTGGSWFSEGRLDIGLVDTISKVIEHFVSTHSWKQVELEEPEDITQSPSKKRKRPTGGFDERGTEKAKPAETNDISQKSKTLKGHSPKVYQPFGRGYTLYPTLRDITRHILNIKVTAATLPQNAILQLLQVMVYDDRLFKMHRPPNDDELPDDFVNNTITMYRCFKNPNDLLEQHQMEKRKVSSHDGTRKAALRQQELEDIGPGGASEVPCLRCPVFDICGDGGPVNVVTCKYFDEWYDTIAEADRELEDNAAQHPSTKDKDEDKTRQHKDHDRRSEKGKGRENESGIERALTNGEGHPVVEVEVDLT